MTRIKKDPGKRTKKDFKTSFEFSEFENALETYLRARVYWDCRLVASLHDYSHGVWIEWSDKKPLAAEDFVLLSEF